MSVKPPEPKPVTPMSIEEALQFVKRHSHGILHIEMSRLHALLSGLPLVSVSPSEEATWKAAMGDACKAVCLWCDKEVPFIDGQHRRHNLNDPRTYDTPDCRALPIRKMLAAGMSWRKSSKLALAAVAAQFGSSAPPKEGANNDL